MKTKNLLTLAAASFAIMAAVPAYASASTILVDSSGNYYGNPDSVQPTVDDNGYGTVYITYYISGFVSCSGTTNNYGASFVGSYAVTCSGGGVYLDAPFGNWVLP